MHAATGNTGNMESKASSFDTHYMMLEFSVWFASTFGIDRLRVWVKAAKEDVRVHDTKVFEATQLLEAHAKKTRIYRIASNPTTDDVVSLSFIFGEGDDDLEDFQISDDSPEDNVTAREYSELLRDFLKRGKLSAREREVFMRRTGLDGAEQFTCVAIAKNLGIARQNIEIAERKAMDKCRTFLIKRGFRVEDLR